jgi:hypothetical protein
MHLIEDGQKLSSATGHSFVRRWGKAGGVKMHESDDEFKDLLLH